MEILGLAPFLFERKEKTMSEDPKKIYEDTDELRKIIKNLKGRKFILDCGHKVTFGYWLGNSITILNQKEPEIICTLCSY